VCIVEDLMKRGIKGGGGKGERVTCMCGGGGGGGGVEFGGHQSIKRLYNLYLCLLHVESTALLGGRCLFGPNKVQTVVLYWKSDEG